MPPLGTFLKKLKFFCFEYLPELQLTLTLYSARYAYVFLKLFLFQRNFKEIGSVKLLSESDQLGASKIRHCKPLQEEPFQ